MPSLENMGRFVVRGLIAVFTAVVLLLFQSAFWTTAVSPAMSAVLIAVAVVAYFRPHIGLLLVAAFTPLGRLISHLLGSPLRCAEALVLAFLAGALLHGWAQHGFRRFPSNRLHIAALVFGLIAVASCIEQLWFLQLQRDFPGAFALQLIDYATQHYLTSFRGFGTIFHAALLLEGMALLLYGVHYCETRSDFAPSLLRMVVCVTVGVAVLNIAFFANELMDTGEPGARFVEFVTSGRFSAHIGDVNAAGSFLVMGLFVAAGMAVVEHRHRALLALGCVAILAAIWLTSSRAAVFSVLLVVMAAAATAAIARSRKPMVTALVSLSIMVTVGLITFRYLPSHFFDSNAARAANIRLMFLATTARMIEAYPVFGLGVGQFSTWSRRFSSPELVAIYPSENAHNNFAQIAGELGLTGLIAFLCVLYISLYRPHHQEPVEQSRFIRPVLVGLAAFLVTCLAGHPLLIPEVSYGFWLILAVVPGLLHVRDRLQSTSGPLVALCAIILTASIGARIYLKMPLINWASITYGLADDRFISSRARLFIPCAAACDVMLPFRARAASPETPVEMDVLVDDKIVETITITDRVWRSTHLPLENHKTNQVHRIDLQIRNSDTARSRRAVEVGERRIIPKPHG